MKRLGVAYAGSDSQGVYDVLGDGFSENANMEVRCEISDAFAKLSYLITCIEHCTVLYCREFL